MTQVRYRVTLSAMDAFEESGPVLSYYNGAFMRPREVVISPHDRGFQLADGVYEVIRVYQGVPFAFDAHLARFERSAKAIRLSPVSRDEIGAAVSELLNRAGFASSDCLVYIQLTRGVFPRTHAFPPAAIPPTLYMDVTRTERGPHPEPQLNAAVTVQDERWENCHIKSIALLPNVLARQKAAEAGVDEAVLVRPDGTVTEGASSNIAAVFRGTVTTHPEGRRILSGITRSVALSLCDELGIPLEERPMQRWELDEADEILVFGTSTEVGAITLLDRRQVGTGEAGPIATRLQTAFAERVGEARS